MGVLPAQRRSLCTPLVSDGLVTRLSSETHDIDQPTAGKYK
jgi:hypothetical protein